MRNDPTSQPVSEGVLSDIEMSTSHTSETRDNVLLFELSDLSTTDSE